jgi:uracil-DNA glycosylase
MATWEELFAEEEKQTYFQQIMAYVAKQHALGKSVFPPHNAIFNAFKATPLEQVKVVILGQDPYHGPNQAHGLSFSVLPGVKPPPSLVNIYKELVTDIEGFILPTDGYLQQWAEQGVLLLNTVLTVEQGLAHSHSKIGWERFTDKVISYLNEHTQGTVFLLWGSHAQKKGAVIDAQKHHILRAPHPSPLSAHRGFLGCKHFSQTNQLLIKQNKTAINWQV